METKELSDDERWSRDIKLAHIHGMLVGMKQNLPFDKFKSFWFVLCTLVNEEEVNLSEYDKKHDTEMFETIQTLHLKIIDGALTLSKDDEINNENKTTLLELAKLIDDELITMNGKKK